MFWYVELFYVRLCSHYLRTFRYVGVTDGLKNLYKKQLKPAEDVSLFNEFHGAKMDISADFDSVPMVLVIILKCFLLEFFFYWMSQ